MNRFLSIELKALVKTLLVSLVLGVICAVIVYFTPLKETLLASLGRIILIITVFWAGCYVSKAYASKGLIRGLSMGLIYFILLLMATWLFRPAAISLSTFCYTLLICLVSGGLGGILGIGLSDY